MFFNAHIRHISYRISPMLKFPGMPFFSSDSWWLRNNLSWGLGRAGSPPVLVLWVSFIGHGVAVLLCVWHERVIVWWRILSPSLLIRVSPPEMRGHGWDQSHFGQWWILSCAFLHLLYFELSCVATYRSFPLVSFFLLRWLTLWGKGYFQLWRYPLGSLICNHSTSPKCFVSISFIDTCCLCPWDLLWKGVCLDIQKTSHIPVCFVTCSSSIRSVLHFM